VAHLDVLPGDEIIGGKRDRTGDGCLNATGEFGTRRAQAGISSEDCAE